LDGSGNALNDLTTSLNRRCRGCSGYQLRTSVREEKITFREIA
jgi:hypothetical protein